MVEYKSSVFAEIFYRIGIGYSEFKLSLITIIESKTFCQALSISQSLNLSSSLSEKADTIREGFKKKKKVIFITPPLERDKNIFYFFGY